MDKNEHQEEMETISGPASEKPIQAAAADEKQKEEKKQGEESKKKALDPKKEKRKKIVQEINSWVTTIVAAVLIAAFVRSMVAEPIRVSGRSMVNTLQDGEIVLVTKNKMLKNAYRRGDVVICHYPGRTTGTYRLGASLTLTSHVPFVKRIVALPGDAVALMDGKLYVNDTLVEEDFIDYPSHEQYPRRVLGADEYFVMGDNRANSHDSRANDVGPITSKMIVGHAKVVLFPLNKIRVVK